MIFSGFQAAWIGLGILNCLSTSERVIRAYNIQYTDSVLLADKDPKSASFSITVPEKFLTCREQSTYWRYSIAKSANCDRFEDLSCSRQYVCESFDDWLIWRYDDKIFEIRIVRIPGEKQTANKSCWILQ